MKAVRSYLIVVCLFIVVLGNSASLGAEKWNPEQKEILRSVKTIRINVDSSSWYTDHPFDVRSYVKDQLKNRGYRIVKESDPTFDAELEVIYRETSASYQGITPDWALGTSIDCYFDLKHPTIGYIWSIAIHDGSVEHANSYSKGDHRTKAEHYRNANSDFKSNVHLKYLGRIIASQLGSSEDMVTILIDALNDRNELTREQAAEQLAMYDDPRSIQPFIDALRKDNFQAIRGLGRVGDQRAVGPLIEKLSAKDSGSRLDAVIALENLSSRRGIDCKQAIMPLVKLLDDPDGFNRGWVVGALGFSGIGDERAIEPLRIAASKHPELSGQIDQAIKSIQKKMQKD